jgi:uncharacterized protein YutE (UPF0331/DUF86 family)
MGYILEKLYTLPEDTTALDDLGIDGVLYRVQTSIDAAMDMAAMLVRDIGIDVGDDYENIDVLKEKGVIDAGLTDELKRLNGMRNAIVHKYGNVDTELILHDLENVKEQLRNFIDTVEGELS